MDSELFQTDPRDYAMMLCQEDLADVNYVLLCALQYMSHDDVRDMLDCNELSPRFDEDED